MLPRSQRLTKRQDFDRLYRFGTRLGGVYSLLRTDTNRLPQSRFGVVISTKTAKRATTRNSHKRQVRVVLAELAGSIPEGYDMLVTIQKTVKSRSEWPAFREDLRKLFKRRFSL